MALRRSVPSLFHVAQPWPREDLSYPTIIGPVHLRGDCPQICWCRFLQSDETACANVYMHYLVDSRRSGPFHVDKQKYMN